MRDSSRDAIPPEWVACTLADAVVPGRPRGNPADFVGQPFVGLEHIEAHTTRMLGSVPAETMKSSGVVFEEGDVLYARMRPYLNKVWLADRDGLCSGEFIVFPKTGALRGAFLKYRLNAQDFVSFTDHATTGDRPRADFADFGKFPVLVPPLAEQARIADRIDELFTDLAAGVAALERVKRNLSRYRAAVLHAAVTGRLTEAWRKEHSPLDEPAAKLLERILVERRKQWERRTLAAYEAKGKQPPKNWKSRYKEPAPPKPPEDGTSLPDLPKGWCWANLECLKQFSMYGPRFSSDDYVSDGVRVLRTTDFDDAGNIDLSTPPMLPLTDEQFEDYGLEPGDLLVTRTGSLGTLAVFQGGARAIAGAFLIYYRLNHEHVDHRFAFFVLKAPAGQRELRRRGTGVGRPNLNIPSIDSIDIPLPPLAEQSAIVEAVNEKLSQIDALEAEVARGLARAGRLRQAILKAAFEGKLVPQDPSDEPASVLLDRIRQKAAAAPKPKRKTRKKRAANA